MDIWEVSAYQMSITTDYYDHAYSFEQSDDGYNTYFLAETFSDFLKSMKQDV